jgi:hypothetical protein
MRQRVPAVVFLSILSCAACASTGTVRYVKLVNTTKDSISAFGVARAGSDDFRDFELGANGLHGGGESIVVAIDVESGCVRDLRTVFADGRVLIDRGFDICRRDRYQPSRKRGDPERALASEP